MGDYGEEGDSVHFFLIAVKNGPEDTASFVLAHHFVQENVTWLDVPLDDFPKLIAVEYLEIAAIRGMALRKEDRIGRWYFGGLASAGAACCTHPLDLLKAVLLDGPCDLPAGVLDCHVG
ncbi:hypothetical protein RB195_024583 [Necator americanus]|uniref:Uncharacterized protein n=1 Tax=Necator americanus TaxID=51031 RepID=A0ABR1ENV2_NECAM